MKQRHFSLPLLPCVAGCVVALALRGVAQNDFGHRAIDTGAPVTGVIANDKIPTWMVQIDAKTMLGSSLRTNKSSIIQGQNTLQVLQVGRLPMIVQDGTSGKFWGLNLYGDFVPLDLPNAPSITQFSQDLFGVIEGNACYVFGHWGTTWRKITLSSTSPRFLAGRGCLLVQDDRDLYGFSTLFQDQPAKFSVPGSTIVAPMLGTGEIDSRRNFQAYEISPTSVAIYSAYLNAWRTLDVGTSLVNTVFDYDKNTLTITDSANNRIWAYSSLTGLAFPRNFSDVSALTVSAQDFGVEIVDPGKDILYFRAADSQFSVLAGRAADLVAGGVHSNNHTMVALTDQVTKAVDFWAVSSTSRNATFVPAGVGATETVLSTDGNDCVSMVVTDKSLYGFSAFTNKWAKFTGYKGTVAGSDAEDFIGRVHTDTHAYCYSPRDDRWSEIAISSTARVQDTDQAVIVTEATSKAVFSMQSLDWRKQTFQGTLFQAGNENDYTFSLFDAATGGSTLWFFQNYGDRWLRVDLKNRVTDTKNVVLLEDGLLIVDGNTVHAISGYGDMSSNWTAPNDNAAYHAVPSAFARFVATGPVGAPGVILLGFDRFDVAIPGITGELQVGLKNLLILPAGAYGSDGTMRFNITLIGVAPQRYRFQMLGFDAVKGFSLGRLLDFQVF